MDMINKQLITRRFSRAVESYNREATAQKQIAYRMNDMLAHYLVGKEYTLCRDYIYSNSRVHG